jgi:hypothetical protein
MAINAITATGTTQATAYPLPATGKILAVAVGTVPAGSGVMLPGFVDANGCQEVAIWNQSGTAVLVYPQPGGTLDGGSANAGVSLDAATVVIYRAFSPIDWHS